jgi:hypothetical protein
VLAIVAIGTPAVAQTNVFHDDWSGYAIGSSLISNGYDCMNAPTSVHGARGCGGISGYLVTSNTLGTGHGSGKYATVTDGTGGWIAGNSHLIRHDLVDGTPGNPSAQTNPTSGIVHARTLQQINALSKNMMTTWTHSYQTDWFGSGEMKMITTFQGEFGGGGTDVGMFAAGPNGGTYNYGSIVEVGLHTFEIRFTYDFADTKSDVTVIDLDATGTTSTGFTGVVVFPDLMTTHHGPINRLGWGNCCAGSGGTPIDLTMSYEVIHPIYGDTDLDDDVDSSDAGNLIPNWTGPLAASTGTKTWGEGDTDNDGDVDSSDAGRMIPNWTGPLAGNLIPSPGVADLVYNPATGGVTLVPSSGDGVITNFVLKSAGGFLPPHNCAFCNFTYYSDPNEMSETDFSFVGFSGPHFMGNIMPAGMDLVALEAFLTQATYAGALGGEGGDLDLVIPEPATLALMGLGGLLVLRRRRAA